MKTNIDRRNYYVHKTAEYFYSGNQKPYRHGRLARYQEALNKRLIENDERLKRRYNWF